MSTVAKENSKQNIVQKQYIARRLPLGAQLDTDRQERVECSTRNCYLKYLLMI